MKKVTPRSIIMDYDQFVSQGSQPIEGNETVVIADEPTGVPGVLTVMDMPSALALARYEIEVREKAPADSQTTTE